MTRGTKKVIFRVIWFWNRTGFWLFHFLSSFLAEPAWLRMSDAREWHSYFLAQEVATANLHETTLFFFPLWGAHICTAKEHWSVSCKTFWEAIFSQFIPGLAVPHWSISHSEKMSHAGWLPILISLMSVELVRASHYSLLLWRRFQGSRWSTTYSACFPSCVMTACCSWLWQVKAFPCLGLVFSKPGTENTSWLHPTIDLLHPTDFWCCRKSVSLCRFTICS